MAAFMIVSDRPPEEYQAFLTQAIQDLSDYAVRGVALVALLEEPDEDEADVLTAYFNMNLQDKQLAAGNIQADVVDGIVRANMRRYLEELEDGQE